MPESTRRASLSCATENSPPPPELFTLVQSSSWVKVVQRATNEPKEAEYVAPTTNWTCLHVAVQARNTSNPSARIAAIRALLKVYPQAAGVGDAEYGYTPLAYACMVDDCEDTSESLQNDSEVVRLMMEFCPTSYQVLAKDGSSALELHIIKMSRLAHSNHFSCKSHAMVLKALLTNHSTVVLPSTTAKALDVLLECNSLLVLEQLALTEAYASSKRLRARRQARRKTSTYSSDDSVQSGSTAFADLWVWEWVLLLLQADMKRRHPTLPFYCLHAAAQVKDCPLAFLLLAMRAYPEQVRESCAKTKNLPLHMVAAWDVSDPATVSRKSMALNALALEYPVATKLKNARGKTPMSLALETGTSWDNGIRRLSTFSREQSVANFSSTSSTTTTRSVR